MADDMQVNIASVPRNKCLPIGLAGESGSGKTYSALLLARGLAGADGKVVLIDTEGERSKIYANDADIGGFYTIDLAPPFTPARCVSALNSAIKSGAAAIILDSATDTYSGTGGLLEMADDEGKRMKGGDSVRKWIKPKAEYQKFRDAVFRCPVPMILTFREESKIIMQEKLTPDGKPELNMKGQPKTQPVEQHKIQYEKNFPNILTIILRLERAGNKIHIVRLPKPFASIFREGETIDASGGAALMKYLRARQDGGSPATAEASESAPAADKPDDDDLFAKWRAKLPRTIRQDSPVANALLRLWSASEVDVGGSVDIAWRAVSPDVQETLKRDFNTELRNIRANELAYKERLDEQAALAAARQ